MNNNGPAHQRVVAEDGEIGIHLVHTVFGQVSEVTKFPAQVAALVFVQRACCVRMVKKKTISLLTCFMIQNSELFLIPKYTA